MTNEPDFFEEAKQTVKNVKQELHNKLHFDETELKRLFLLEIDERLIHRLDKFETLLEQIDGLFNRRS